MSCADCIIWLDQRAHEERNYIEEILGNEAILEITSNDPLVSYWAPKLFWLKKHKSEVYQKISKVLFPKDYLKYMLTGVYDIDVTDATATMLFDTKNRKWSKELFQKLEIPYDFVLEKTSESTDVGYVTYEAADFLGIAPGIPVVAGGGDQMCGAIGLGIVETGRVASTIGTSGFRVNALEKIVRLREMLLEGVEIWVDGGITVEQLEEVAVRGANKVVMGRAVFG